jgi:hypothetical protein
MTGGMGRSKARTLRTIIDKEPEHRCYFKVLAGPWPHDQLFDKLTAYKIGDGSSEQKARYPPPSLGAEIYSGKKNKEEIKRNPVKGFPEKRKYKIKESITPVLIDMGDKPYVHRLNGLPEIEKVHAAKVRGWET